MKLLIYTLNYAPEPTATGKYTGEMAAWLAARGHEVHAIAAPPHYPAWKIDEEYRGKGFLKEDLEGVHVMRAPLYVPPPERLSAKTRILLESTHAASSLRHWFPILLQPETYDAVIAVCPPMQTASYAWLYNKLRQVPWVFHIQDLQVDEAVRLGLVKNRTAGWALRGIETFFLKNADRVTTITQAMRRRIVEKGVPEENTWLFPNWADIGHMRPGSKDTEFRRTLGISLDDVLVMYAGNMGDKQGLEIVLQAAHRLREHPEIRFVMIGAGAARARMESMAQELDLQNLQFLPVQPLERLPEVFASSDLHLVVQKREAADLVMPSKLTNICAAGRPCVATTDPGTALHDAVVGSNLGVAVPPQDEEALAASIERLAADSPRRVEMGRNARVFAQEKLDKETILKEFETHLKKLTAGF